MSIVRDTTPHPLDLDELDKLYRRVRDMLGDAQSVLYDLDHDPDNAEVRDHAVKLIRDFEHHVVFAHAQIILAHSRDALQGLGGEPDRDAVDRALRMLAIVRDGLRAHQMMNTVVIHLRDTLAAGIVAAAPHLTMSTVGQAAGVNDTRLSRIVRAQGGEPRTKRPPKKRADTSTP